mgnify:CR=1 FL=1
MGRVVPLARIPNLRYLGIVGLNKNTRLGMLKTVKSKLFTLALVQLVLGVIVYRSSVEEFFPNEDYSYLVIMDSSWIQYVPLYISFVFIIGYLLFIYTEWSKLLYLLGVLVSFIQIFKLVDYAILGIWTINVICLVFWYWIRKSNFGRI